MLAAFLYAQLESREKIQKIRNGIWNRYFTSLGEWASKNGIRLPYIPEHCEQAYHMFYLIMPSLAARQALITHLKSLGILSVYHYVPLHNSEMGLKFGGDEANCPITEFISDCLVRLPFYNDLSVNEQDEVIEAVMQFNC